MCRQPPSFTSPALANIYHLLRGNLPEWQNLESRARREWSSSLGNPKTEGRNPKEGRRPKSEPDESKWPIVPCCGGLGTASPCYNIWATALAVCSSAFVR